MGNIRISETDLNWVTIDVDDNMVLGYDSWKGEAEKTAESYTRKGHQVIIAKIVESKVKDVGVGFKPITEELL